jgi:hypothetical protein
VGLVLPLRKGDGHGITRLTVKQIRATDELVVATQYAILLLGKYPRITLMTLRILDLYPFAVMNGERHLTRPTIDYDRVDIVDVMRCTSRVHNTSNRNEQFSLSVPLYMTSKKINNIE